MSNIKHIVALSGGESSAIVGIEVARKFGIENLVLLNHDINPAIEPADVFGQGLKKHWRHRPPVSLIYSDCQRLKNQLSARETASYDHT